MLTSVLFCQVSSCGKLVENYADFCGKTCGIVNSAGNKSLLRLTDTLVTIRYSHRKRI